MQKQLPRRCSVRKDVLIEKETLAQVLSCEFYKISKNVFFTKQLWFLYMLFILRQENGFI